MTADDIRTKYLKFFEKRGHTIIPSAPLVPENDPSTLFVSAGMQPLIPYLMGEIHPEGTRLVNYQKCVRTGDIDEVGDAFHHTFFEMLGNWSLGDYFKQESIPWSYEFLTQELNISPDRLSVSVFAGDKDAPRDAEAAAIWKSLGIPEERIYFFGKEDNWWAAGPTGPCGPDTEIFFDVTQVPCGPDCKPGDNCGRYFEIWNNVFMVYNRKEDGTLEELPKKNVDTGMGLERTTTVLQGKEDNYQTELFLPVIKTIEKVSSKTYAAFTKEMRIIADHTRAAIFMISDGVTPGNKLQGYVLRRLMRRMAVKFLALMEGVQPIAVYMKVVEQVIEIYKDNYPELEKKKELFHQIFAEEITKFSRSLVKGMNEARKLEKIDGKIAFDFYQTYGFPLEVTEEIFREKGQEINRDQFQKEFEKHRKLSRTASAGTFKGGLADHSEETTKLHTATHLLHTALRKVLGDHVSQKGSNITTERLRFDFTHPAKLSEEEIKRVEDLVNDQIAKDLPVTVEILPLEKAIKSGALAFFGGRYGAKVKVYSIGDFSKEVCGGPHVARTGVLGRVKIKKEEAISSGVRRIYAALV